MTHPKPGGGQKESESAKQRRRRRRRKDTHLISVLVKGVKTLLVHTIPDLNFLVAGAGGEKKIDWLAQ